MARFYGGPVGQWLDTPICLIRACADQLPRLQASEQLSAISASAMGAGRVKKSAADKARRQLEKAARKGERAQPVSPGVLGAHGIRAVAPGGEE